MVLNVTEALYKPKPRSGDAEGVLQQQPSR